MCYVLSKVLCVTYYERCSVLRMRDMDTFSGAWPNVDILPNMHSRGTWGLWCISCAYALHTHKQSGLDILTWTIPICGGLLFTALVVDKGSNECLMMDNYQAAASPLSGHSRPNSSCRVWNSLKLFETTWDSSLRISDLTIGCGVQGLGRI